MGEEKKKKEKKIIKISLGAATVIGLIVIVTVIALIATIVLLINRRNHENTVNATANTTSSTNVTTNTTSTTNTVNEISNTTVSTTSTLSENEARNILKNCFNNMEKLYSLPNEFFGVEFGKEIKDFDKTILKYGTENLLKEVKNHLPGCIIFENGKYNLMNGGGAREYNGLDKFENIKITDNKITATLKTKQNGPDANGQWVAKESKSSEFVLVKSGDTWLVDTFNSKDLD